VIQTKVFQVGSGWFPHTKGGAENMFFALFEGLQREGFAVRGIVAGSDQVSRETGGLMRGFPVDGVWMPRRAVSIRRSARQSFNDAHPDLIASHFALYSLPLLDRLAQHPMVLHFYGPWALESAVEGASAPVVAAKKALERVVYRRSRRAIVMSRAFGDLLRDYYGVPSEIIRVVPGGVDCARYDLPLDRAAARERLGWSAERPTVFVVRRLVRRMGLDRLLDAVAMLRRDRNDVAQELVLHVAGSGPERAALQARAAALGLSETVLFDGFLSDDQLPLAYRAADLTLMPTRELEGFGLVVVESLAAGTPVMVTPVGGLPEVVEGLATAGQASGMTLRGSTAADIAAGLGAWLDGSALLPDAASCRAYARQRFDWSVISPQVASIYREALQ